MSFPISLSFNRRSCANGESKIFSTEVFLKEVALTREPSREPAFPPIISSMCPMVIRDGTACGLMTKSGEIPSAVNGMFSCMVIRPQTPFCPCLDANLSPISGTRRSRVLTLTRREEFSDSVTITVSTIPVSLLLMVMEVSRRFSTAKSSPVGSSRKRGGEVFPIKTSFSLTMVSGLMIPSTSRLT